jgi:hypothetical protein
LGDLVGVMDVVGVLFFVSLSTMMASCIMMLHAYHQPSAIDAISNQG